MSVDGSPLLPVTVPAKISSSTTAAAAGTVRLPAGKSPKRDMGRFYMKVILSRGWLFDAVCVLFCVVTVMIITLAPTRLGEYEVPRLTVIWTNAQDTLCDDLDNVSSRSQRIARVRDTSPVPGEAIPVQESPEQCKSRLSDAIFKAYEVENNSPRLLPQNIQRAPPRLGETIKHPDLCLPYFESSQMTRSPLTDALRQDTSRDSSDVTMVSHTSAPRWRLERMMMLIEHWTGPMSLSVYTTLDESPYLVSTLCSSEVIRSRTNIGVHLVLAKGEFYPGNYLRNLAINETRTKYLFLNDIDLIPCPNMFTLMMRHVRSGLLEKKQVLVVPAFETEVNITEFKFPADKDSLLNMWDLNYVQSFYEKDFQAGHAATNFEKWKRTMGPYSIAWEYKYEPYIAMKTSETPQYFTKFVGRYRNKITQIMEIAARGYGFVVLPDVFVVHLPHVRDLMMKYFTCAMRVNLLFERKMKETYPDFKFPIV